MHSRFAQIAITVLSMAILPSPGSCQQPSSTLIGPAYRKWLNEDVFWIITTKERRELLNLVTDAQCDQFITNFWERRNPHPGKENAFKLEHYRRLEFSNEHFAAGIPGWKTDRGRIYIVYGPPDSMKSISRPGESPEEDWFYRHIEGIGDNISVTFVDECSCGAYELKKAPEEMY